MSWLKPTRCAICGQEGNASEIYPARLEPEDLRPEIFSARRKPDGVHYRLVKCQSCGLVRSDPAADPRRIAQIYSESGFDYEGEVENLTATYGRSLRQVVALGGAAGSLLEIGCGNGFFLEEALRQGFRDVRGIEPSADAIRCASPAIGPRIVPGVFGRGAFEPGTFDVICLFQVLDHLPDPAGALEAACEMLKPGGRLLCLNHDVEAMSARVLGEKSPIVDVEHTFLFGKKTLRRLMESSGFRVERIGTAWNRCSLRYLLHLLPLPDRMKKSWIACADRSPLGRISLWLPLGNLFGIGRRPSLEASAGK
ncbi:MAG: methyltransferase domain-containing protein [Acidobacteriota bacterium]